MSKLYDVTLIGKDDLDSWAAAAAFAASDLRVMFLIESAPDPGLPLAFDSPIDPGRVTNLMRAAGLKPTAAPRPSHLPDFQVIVAGKPIDVIANGQSRVEFAARDWGELAGAFEDYRSQLKRMAEDIVTSAAENDFPLESSETRERPFWKRLRLRSWRPPETEPFKVWCAGAPSEARGFFLAAASGLGGFPVTGDAPAAQVALLLGAMNLLYPGLGPEGDYRERAAESIARRGSVMEARPESILTEGRRAISLRLRGGSIIDTRTLVAPTTLVSALTGKTVGAGDRGPGRTTWFFKMERDTIPESLAARSILIKDPEGPTSGTNLMILARGPRVPRRDTLAVTMFEPPEGLGAAEVPAVLAEALPWMDPSKVKPDEEREEIVTRGPSRTQEFYKRHYQKTGLENVFPLPSSILPGWGIMGTALALEGLVLAVAPMVKKYRDRER